MTKFYNKQRDYATNEEAKRGTLCWLCQNATNSGCSWSARFKPVKGWTATPTLIKNAINKRTEEVTLIPSYFVHKCPQFKSIEPIENLEKE